MIDDKKLKPPPSCFVVEQKKVDGTHIFSVISFGSGKKSKKNQKFPNFQLLKQIDFSDVIEAFAPGWFYFSAHIQIFKRNRVESLWSATNQPTAAAAPVGVMMVASVGGWSQLLT